MAFPFLELQKYGQLDIFNGSNCSSSHIKDLKKMPIHSRIALFIILGLSFVQCASRKETPPAGLDEKVGRVADSLQGQYHFNGNILIAKGGKVVYKRNVGVANYYTQAPLNDSTLFELASVSKQFTAMGIMILAEAGKLKYSDDVRKYLPDIPYEGITLYRLLTHTSGLPEYEDLFAQKWDHSKIAFNKDVIALLHQYKTPLLFHPGEKWQYSNTGYALLASVIEKVSGEKYGDFLNHKIFTPVGMAHTRTYNTRRSGEVIPNYAYGFVYSDEQKKYVLPDSVKALQYVYYLDGIEGDGVVNSTIMDLYKWDRALYTPLLVSPATLQKAFTPAKLNDSTTYDYGFGWSVSPSSTFGPVYSHSGGWPGYHTFILRMTDQDICVILLSNNQSEGLTTIAKTIAKSLLPKAPAAK